MSLIDDEVKKKIKFLELVKESGNIANSVRIMGFSQTSYYRFKKIYEREGEKGLRRLVKGKPKLSREIEEEILKVSSQNPKWGSVKIQEYLNSQGIKVSETATYDILKKHGLNLRLHRLKNFRKNSEKSSS